MCRTLGIITLICLATGCSPESAATRKLREENAQLKRKLREKNGEPVRPQGTGIRSSSDWVKKQESPEFKLDRAKQQIRDLDQEISEAKEQVARTEIERDRIAADVLQLDEQLVIQRDEMLILKNDLESGSGPFEYGGRTYTAADVTKDLELRLTAFQDLEEKLARKQETLATLNKQLNDQFAQVRKMEQNKEKFQIEVAKLEARLGSIRAKEAASEDGQVVDSNASDIRETLDEVNGTVATKEKMLDDHKGTGRIPVSRPNEKTDILERATKKFNPDSETVIKSSK